jgi:hypothetical protein
LGALARLASPIPIQAQQSTDDKRIKVDAVKNIAQMQNDKQRQYMDLGVDVLTQLSNKSHEEQLRHMQERIQMRQQQPKQPTKGE